MRDVDLTRSGLFDVAVVGGGVVGCAIARRFTLEGARVVLLEKAPDILDGASKGNSGILHTGFDAPVGSLEAACVKAGHAEYLEIRERLGLPLDRCGALVIAWTDQEADALSGLLEKGRRNGIGDLEMLDAAETRRLEPHLGPGVRASFRVPGESLIDPWAAPNVYLLQAIVNGAAVLRNAAVTGGRFDAGRWRLDTRIGAVDARIVINAAGLYGDLLDEALLGERRFAIRPRKGQFVVYDKTAAGLARHILLPVPTAITKGIVVCRTAYGNLIVGPTAEEQDDRRTAAVDRETLERLMRRGAEILPALQHHDVTTVYAGLRPATETPDYRILVDAGRNAVTVGGIRSTGLSAALGIAAHVRALCAPLLGDRTPLVDPVWPAADRLAEHGPRDWQEAGNGGIVCHCERVTRREIEAVLEGPLPVNTLAGLKRRTRVTMGRCQGFYCSAALAAITRGRLDPPMVGGGDA